MACGWLLVALMALGAAPLRWLYYDDPLQACRSRGDIDTLDGLALCLQRFVVPEGAIPASHWREDAGFIPTEQQRHDLSKLVRKMTTAPSAVACKKLLLPASLRPVYHPPAAFHDSGLGETVCLLLERSRRGRFVAGWGWLVVRPEPEPVVKGGEVEEEVQEVLPKKPTEGDEQGKVEEDREEEREKERDEEREEEQLERGGKQPAKGRQLQRRMMASARGAWSWARGWIGIGIGSKVPPPGRPRKGQRPAAAAAAAAAGEGAAGEGAAASAASATESPAMLLSGWSLRGRPLPRLHLGAPHPGFEGPVDLQAVALFRRLPSLARSVVVSGKHRRATPADSACLPALGYPASDPSHNDRDAFNAISFALLRLEQQELGNSCGLCAGAAGSVGAGGGGGGGGGGRGSLAVFLQLHGKAVESCPASTVFASGGFGRNASRFYGRADTPVARLAAELEAAAGRGGGGGGGGWAARTPPGDPGCGLVATRNVFGRVVNGVLRREACSRPADGSGIGGEEVGAAGLGPGDGGEGEVDGVDEGEAEGGAPGAGGGGGGGGRWCFGSFIHVEQAEEARAPAAWDVWARALGAAMG